jgi:hypothetical protein
LAEAWEFVREPLGFRQPSTILYRLASSRLLKASGRPSNLIHWKNLDFAGTDFFNRIGRDPSMGAGHVRVWQRSAMIGR